MLKRQIRELWELCFQDSKAFTELYFTHRYNSNVNIYIQSGEEIIAAMQTLPYPMTFCQETIPTAYVSGACTHPDYRNRGVMKELLHQAFARMQDQGVLLSTLIPASDYLFDYYRKSGYASVFSYSEKNLLPEQSCEQKTKLKIEALDAYNENAYNYLNEKMQERPCCIQHTITDFKVIMAALQLEDGKVFVATSGKKICGIAICQARENVLLVSDILTDTKEAEEALICRAAEQWGCNKMSILCPSNEEMKKHQLGMIRIIDAKKILQLFATAFPLTEMSIELTDNTISNNNGYYYLNNGRCMKSQERLFKTHQKYTIETLAETLFSPMNPYMSLMLN